MASTKQPVIQAALDLAWSHWSGLGVRGSFTAPDTAVDPEALIYLTASLAEHDPRLGDEAMDWWSRFQHHVSRPRLSRLARRFDRKVVSSFELLEAGMEKRVTSGKSRLERLDHPARALLRLRSIFGANARAEILLALLTQWSDASEGVTALALSEVGYSKRNVALILDDLRLAGIVVMSTEANRARYRLARADALRQAIGPIPRASGRWHIRLPVVADFVELAKRLRGKDQVVQAVEARKLIAKHASAIAALGLDEPASGLATAYWQDVQAWLVSTVMSEPRDDSRSIANMIEGVWIGPDRELRRPGRMSSGVLPRLTADPYRDDEIVCLDLVQVETVDPPNDWAWAVLSDATRNTYSHMIGMDRGERWHFAAWPDADVVTYRAELASSLPHTQIARA